MLQLFLNIIFKITHLWLCRACDCMGGGPLVTAGASQAVAFLGARGLRDRGLQRAGSIVAERGLSCSEARGIFLGQGRNPSILHWQAVSLSLSHQ